MTDGEPGDDPKAELQKALATCGYKWRKTMFYFHVKKTEETYVGINALRRTINATFSIFRVVIPIAEIKIQSAFVKNSITLENIEYCTKYDLEIHVKGKKKSNPNTEEFIGIIRGDITKQEPSQFVTPKVAISEEYTNLTCSARYDMQFATKIFNKDHLKFSHIQSCCIINVLITAGEKNVIL